MSVTDWIKPFLITSVFRSDLLRVSLTQAQAAAFTDEDMLRIAQVMKDRYLEGSSIPTSWQLLSKSSKKSKVYCA